MDVNGVEDEAALQVAAAEMEEQSLESALVLEVHYSVDLAPLLGWGYWEVGRVLGYCAAEALVEHLVLEHSDPRFLAEEV